MAETFIWGVQQGAQVTRTPNVAVVKLGDGYEQRQVKGINTLLDTYSITIKGTDGLCGRTNAAKEADAFLRARMAVEAFNWTPTDTGTQALFVCRSWNMTKTGPHYELTADFEQVAR
jgi:phage-related protein